VGVGNLSAVIVASRLNGFAESTVVSIAQLGLLRDGGPDGFETAADNEGGAALGNSNTPAVSSESVWKDPNGTRCWGPVILFETGRGQIHGGGEGMRRSLDHYRFQVDQHSEG
jgi:hypothetical protein